MNYHAVSLGDLMIEPMRNGLTRPKKVRGSGYKMVNMGELFAHDRIGSQEMDLVPMNDRDLQLSSLRYGDLLFARQSLVRSGVGKCSIVEELPENTTFESHIIRVRVDPIRSDPEFLFHFFRSEEARLQIERMTAQVAASGIRGSDLAKVMIRLPSIIEQRRIVDILNRAASIERLRDQANGKLRALIPALIPALFVKMFGDPLENPLGWPTALLGDLGNLDRGRSRHRPRNAPELYGGSHPFIQTGDVANSGGLMRLTLA